MTSNPPVPPRDLAVILAGAGMGSRMGSTPKVLYPILGRPALLRVAATFLDHPAVGEVIAVVPTEHEKECRLALGGVPNVDGIRLVAVRGGATREGSVGYGLAALAMNLPFVAVHDVARILVSISLIDRVLEAARRTGAAIPALPVVDTLKEVTHDGRRVVRSVPRKGLMAAQTPQIFSSDILRKAYSPLRDLSREATDESGLAERLGIPVSVVEGETTNMKLTYPQDVAVLEAMAKMYQWRTR